MLVGGALGAGVARGAVRDAQGRDLHHPPHARRRAGVEQRDGGVGMHGLQRPAGAVAQHAHGVDHGVDAGQMRQPGLGRERLGKIQRGAVRRLRCTGSWPACFRLSTIWRPMNPVPPQTRIRMMTSHFSDYRNIRSAFALGAAVGGCPERMKRCTLAPRRNTLSSVEGTGAASRRSRCPAIPSGAMSRARGPGCRAIPPRSRARRSGRAASARWDRIRAACARARWCAAVPNVGGGVEVVAPVAGSAAAADQAPVQQFLEAVADIGRAAFRVSAISSAFSGLPWKRAARGSARPSGSRPSCCPCLPSGE